MPVKDLYYQKYLKYKTKYLNLLRQTGGAPIFITKKDDTITINNKGTTNFSVELLNKPDITTIKLENVMEYSDIILDNLKSQDFSNINTLIFDGNDLSTEINVKLIVSIIYIFKNVTVARFNDCNFTQESYKALYTALNKKVSIKSNMASMLVPASDSYIDSENGSIWQLN